MKAPNVVEHLERLEDQLQAIKWEVRSLRPVGITRISPPSIITKTAGLLRGRVSPGRTHQRRARSEWERRFSREIS